MKHLTLFALLFVGCSATTFADEHELTHTPGGFMKCPPGTKLARATWDNGKRTGAVCCRYGRCEQTNMDGDRIDGDEHAY